LFYKFFLVLVPGKARTNRIYGVLETYHKLISHLLVVAVIRVTWRKPWLSRNWAMRFRCARVHLCYGNLSFLQEDISL